MTDQPRTLHLNAFLMTTGHHEASWRLPESDPHAATSIRHYINLAQIAERATFDSLFLADGPSLWNDVGPVACGSCHGTNGTAANPQPNNATHSVLAVGTPCSMIRNV